MSDPIFVDLSHWNPTPDWAKLKAGGVTGVILKATEGTSYVDPTFVERYAAALDAGLAVASYHFLKHGDATAQMQAYLAAVQPRPGERMIIDYEDEACTLGDLREAVVALTGAGVEVTVYSGHLIKDQLGSKYDDTLAATSLWVAQYTSAASPTWPGGTWDTWSLWQYTDKAQVAGIGQPVDGNRFNGSDEQALKWLNPAVAPQPEPGPVDVVDVLVRVDVSPGLTWAVEINGQKVIVT